jgi:hypothetical protein
MGELRRKVSTVRLLRATKKGETLEHSRVSMSVKLVVSMVEKKLQTKVDRGDGKTVARTSCYLNLMAN